MNRRYFFEKVCMAVLVICGMLFIVFNKAEAQTATATFKVKLEGEVTAGPVQEQQEDDELCFIASITASGKQARYSNADLNNVTITVNITGELISNNAGAFNSILLTLDKSASGYYEGIQTELPIGVELIFKFEAKDGDGEIISQVENNAILEAGNIDIFVILSPKASSLANSIPIVVAKTADTQISPDGTAKIELTIYDDNDQVSYDVTHSTQGGSLSDTGGLITLTNGMKTMEIILTPDSSGNYSDTITIKVDDQRGEGMVINEITIRIQNPEENEGTEITEDGKNTGLENKESIICTQPPTVPENVKIKCGDDGISATLTWNNVSNASSYNVYESDEEGTKKNNYSDVFLAVNSPHTIFNMEYNRTYYFVITAKNTCGESAESAEKKVTTIFQPDCFKNDISFTVVPVNQTEITTEGSCEYTCTIKKVSLAQNFEDIVLFSPAFRILAGEIVKAKSILAGNPEPIRVNRKPLTVSVLGLAYLIDNTRIIEDPYAGSIDKAISEILVSGLEGHAANTAFISVQYIEAHTKEQVGLEANLKLTFDDNNWASAGFKFDGLSESTSLFIKVVQRYYDVAIRTYNSGAEYIAEGVSCEDIFDTVDEGDIPLIISDVSYGRILIYQIITSKETSREKLSAAFKIKVIEGNASSDVDKVFESCDVRLLVLGGDPYAAANVIKSEDARKFFEQGLRWGPDSPGFPLVYTLRSMKKGMPVFSYGLTTEFEIKTCNAMAGDNLWNVKWGACDKDHENNYRLERDGSGGCGNCWHNYTKLGGAKGPGSLKINYGQDTQVYGETWLYVEQNTNLQDISYDADVGRVWLNDVEITAHPLQMHINKGWNHIEVTCYNQNDTARLEISYALADVVAIMDSDGCRN